MRVQFTVLDKFTHNSLAIDARFPPVPAGGFYQLNHMRHQV